MALAWEHRTEFTEERTLEWLGEEISKHVLSGTVGNVNVLVLRLVRDKKISNVNVTGALTTGHFAVAFHFYGTFIVLVEGGTGDPVSLCVHEHLDIHGLWEVVTGAH
jgi:hypothetical protein